MNWKPLPTRQRLATLFHYDCDTGVLTRKSNGAKVGWPLGGGNSTMKHLACKIEGKTYLVHRIIWMMVHKQDPEDMIVDHINGDPSDNRIENLRLATRGENRANSGPNKGMLSGVKGVYKNNGRWMARVTVQGKLKYLGTFDTIEEASAAIDLER